MFRIFALLLWFGTVGLFAWLWGDITKRPGARHDFSHEWPAYTNWLKSQLPDWNMLASLWSNHAPNAANKPNIHWEVIYSLSFWVAVIAVAVAAYAIYFIAQVVSMNGLHEGIALELLGFERSKASTGDAKRRQRTTEDLRNFAEVVRDAGSGIRSIFFNGQQLDLTELVTDMNKRFVDEQDKMKMKTPRLEASAKTWFLLLRGKLKPARNYYRANKDLIKDGNLVSLLEEEKPRLIFMLQTKIVRWWWKHPLYLKVEVEQPDGTFKMLSGMAALFEIQALAPKMTQPGIKSTYNNDYA